MTEFTMNTVVAAPYDETVASVREQLVEAGFGVLTEIDMKATLKAKLDVDIDPQVILGACRPQLAHQAVMADPRLAALMPCNVVVAYVDEDNTRVEVFDPQAMSSFSDADTLDEIAADARARMIGMLEAVGATGA